MRRLFRIGAFLLAAGAGALEAHAAEAGEAFELPAQDSPAAAWWRESMQTRDQRLAWWREARFGMFVHWGVYSGLGNEYEGRKGGGYAEHIQRVLKIPIPEYRANVAGHFNPVKFDADTWIRLAKEAGMGYFVITAKHHDGFAMWPSQVSTYNVMDATPWHHDPMADLRAACKKYGVKFGFYYSHAFDWGEEHGAGNDWDFKNPGGDKKIGGTNWWETMPEYVSVVRHYVDEKAIPQLQELVRKYDPDIFWFDTPQKLPPSENFRVMQAVRAASARVVINGRLVRGWGDYDSTTDRPANFPPHEGDWEGIPTTNESYGWNPKDNSHKPVSHFVQLIAKAAARGGNTLMNIGPMGDGEIDPKDVAILQGLAAWWRVNGESIRGTTRTPLPVQTWGESTRKGDELFLHVFNWPAHGQLVVGGLTANVKSARLLGVGDRGESIDLKVRRLDPLDVSLAIPATPPNTSDAVIALRCEGIQETNTKGLRRLLQPQAGPDILRAFDGQLFILEYGPGKKTDDWVADWTHPGASVTWPVRLREPASYEVFINYDATADSTRNRFKVLVGSNLLEGKVEEGKNHRVSLGRVQLPAGDFRIMVTDSIIMANELFRLRNLELRPVP